MANLKDDIAELRGAIGCALMSDPVSSLAKENNRRQLLALARIASAVGELEHLEYGARFLCGMLKRAEADGLLIPEARPWLEAERARKAAAEPGKAGGSR